MIIFFEHVTKICLIRISQNFKFNHKWRLDIDAFSWRQQNPFSVNICSLVLGAFLKMGHPRFFLFFSNNLQNKTVDFSGIRTDYLTTTAIFWHFLKDTPLIWFIWGVKRDSSVIRSHNLTIPRQARYHCTHYTTFCLWSALDPVLAIE